MLAKSLAVATVVEEDDNDEADVLSARETYKHMRIFRSADQDARLRYMVFEKMASLLLNRLQSAVITDSRKQGKIVLGEAKLVEMKNKNMVLKDNEMMVRVWNARVVRLPSSGYVTKGVTLHVLKFGIDIGVDDCESIAEGSCEGEDGVFAEAAIKMLKRKPASEEHARIIIL